jgi:hypothetical protein
MDGIQPAHIAGSTPSISLTNPASPAQAPARPGQPPAVRALDDPPVVTLGLPAGGLH